MKRNLQFSHILTIMFLLCAFLPSRAQDMTPAVSDNLLVEEGRTWWYGYWCMSMDDDTSGSFGLRLAGAEEREGKDWQKCMVVSEQGTPLLDFPIAWLRREEDKVYVLPHSTTEEQWKEIEAIPNFFSYVYSEFLDVSRPAEWREPVEGEQLLYDWEIKPGERIEYPWIFKLDPENYDIITITSCKTIDNRMTWEGKWGYFADDDIVIVEGIGAINSGTFLYPCSYLDMKVGSIPEYPEEVYLKRVTDKEGNVIYDPEKAGVDDITEGHVSAGTVYDLCGRRVVNPLPGTIYIRDGRKYITR